MSASDCLSGEQGCSRELPRQLKGDGPRAEAPTVTVLYRNLPVVGDWEARDPAEHDKGCAPNSGDDDHEFAKHPVPRPGLEHTEVLEKKCHLDQGCRERVGGVADVEKLTGSQNLADEGEKLPIFDIPS